MEKINLKPVRGMKDCLPEKQLFIEEIIQKMCSIFQKYGFVPMQTPALEYASVLLKKYGEEEKLIFRFKFGEEDLGLKYDQTVPTARVYAANPQLGRPFKRYVIDKAWRGERPQAGRLREFLQCDIDTIGTYSLAADAEILACANEVLTTIGIKNFKWRISTRKLAANFFKSCGVSDIKLQVAMRAIDKLDKLGEQGVKKELLEKGISEVAVDTIFSLLKYRGDLEKIKSAIKIDPAVFQELTEFISYLEKFNVKNYQFDLSLVRGLDYYTGPIFEAVAPHFRGSIAGGGRYNHLIELFSGKEIPATGVSIGLDRILDFLQFKPIKTKTKLYVIGIGTDVVPIVQAFRAQDIPTDLDLMSRGLRGNLDFANKKGIPYVAIIGPEEQKKNLLRLKDMASGKEELLSFEQVVAKLKA
ncbi:MAG: histidine--tRNA ligase [Candidatus Nanoarchaeia archaeon]